jgi:hypothetical protein
LSQKCRKLRNIVIMCLWRSQTGEHTVMWWPNFCLTVIFLSQCKCTFFWRRIGSGSEFTCSPKHLCTVYLPSWGSIWDTSVMLDCDLVHCCHSSTTGPTHKMHTASISTMFLVGNERNAVIFYFSMLTFENIV